MAAMPSSRILRPSLHSAASDAVLSFLVPSAQCARNAPRAHFSTSPARWKGDNNPNRGLSAVRGTGMRKRQTLSVKGEALPKPVKIEAKVTGTEDHGLWGFFKNKELLQTPVAEQQHGRSWTMGELRSHDWDELHQLWWVCVKERNRLATEKIELRRLNAGYGEFEAQERDKTVQESMKAILDTLAERHQAYVEAFELAKNDPTIDLTRTDGPQYIQTPYDPYEAEEPAIEESPKEKPAAESEARPKDKANYA